MGERRSLGTDAFGVSQEFVDFDDSEGTYRIVSQGDNAEFDKYRAMRRNDGSNGFWPSRDMREIGSFSPEEHKMIARIHGVPYGSREHDEVCLKILRDPDYKNLRTTSSSGIPRSVVKPKWV